MKKMLRFFTVISSVLSCVILLGTVVSLFHNLIGFFGYLVGIILSPLFAPALLFLPWFESWVEQKPVSFNFLCIWLIWLVCIFFNLIYHFVTKEDVF